MTRISADGWATLLLLVGVATGCTNLQLPQDPLQSPVDERTDDVVRDFESTRDTNQFQAAVNQLTRGDTKGAEQIARNILARTPSHRAAGLLLADIHLELEQPEAARTQLEGMLAENPNDARIHYTLGLLLETSADPVAAATHFERASVLEPTHEEYQFANSAAEAKIDESAAGTSAAAAPRLAALLAVTQTEQARQLLRSALAGGKAVDTNEATATLTAACRVEPHNRQLPVRTATYLVQSGQPELAVAFLEPVIQSDPQNQALLQVLGAAHLQLGQHPESQDALWQALSLDNANPLSYLLLGCSQRECGFTEEAERSFATAAQLDSRYQVRR